MLLPFPMFRRRLLLPRPTLSSCFCRCRASAPRVALRLTARPTHTPITPRLSRLPFFHHSPFTGQKPLSPIESALTQSAPITPLESALPNSLDLKSFRIRTYRKTGVGGATAIPDCPLFPLPPIRSRKSRVTSRSQNSHPSLSALSFRHSTSSAAVTSPGVLSRARLDYNVRRTPVEGICVPIKWKLPGMAGNRTG
jgi:hypothetical protein